MKLVDTFYGSYQVNDEVLIDLINSSPVTRLKSIMQHGISGLVGITGPITRYDHTIGVMLLIRSLGGSLEEQVAALLHDISHTAFSHVIDFVFRDQENQKYHEKIKYEYIKQTNIPNILNSHGVNISIVVNEENYSILEQEIPNLCADRIDYFFRAATDLGIISIEDCQEFIKHIKIKDGVITIDSLEAAEWIGYSFIEASLKSWISIREIGMNELTAQAIRIALREKILSLNDFWATDAIVWNKLQSCSCSEVKDIVKYINLKTCFIEDEIDPSFSLKVKVRYIDPIVSKGSLLKPLSSLNTKYLQYCEDYLRKYNRVWKIRFTS